MLLELHPSFAALLHQLALSFVARRSFAQWQMQELTSCALCSFHMYLPFCTDISCIDHPLACLLTPSRAVLCTATATLDSVSFCRMSLFCLRVVLPFKMNLIFCSRTAVARRQAIHARGEQCLGGILPVGSWGSIRWWCCSPVGSFIKPSS